MGRRNAVRALAAALAVGACGGDMKAASPNASGTAPGNDPEALWMDDAEVRVAEDACAGAATVELVNPAAGQDVVLDAETFTPDSSCHS